MSGRKLVFISTYTPNYFDINFHNNLVVQLSSMQEFVIIIGADMNATLSSTLDSASFRNKNYQALSTEAFNGLLIST